MKPCFVPMTSILASLILFASGCVQQPVVVEPKVVIADPDLAKSTASVQLLEAESLVVRLPLVTGSGMKWRTAIPPSIDWNVMILKDSIERQPGVAVPGNEVYCHVWRLRATRLGQMTLEFVCDSRYAPQTRPAKRFTLDVDVVKKK